MDSEYKQTASGRGDSEPFSPTHSQTPEENLDEEQQLEQRTNFLARERSFELKMSQREIIIYGLKCAFGIVFLLLACATAAETIVRTASSNEMPTFFRKVVSSLLKIQDGDDDINVFSNHSLTPSCKLLNTSAVSDMQTTRTNHRYYKIARTALNVLKQYMRERNGVSSKNGSIDFSQSPIFGYL